MGFEWREYCGLPGAYLARTSMPPFKIPVACFSRTCPPARISLHSIQSLSLRRHFAATPRTRYARHSPILKSNPEPRKETNVITQSERPTLRENIYTIPNLLTVSRIFACPAIGWSIFNDNFYLATGLLVYAGLSDLVRAILRCSLSRKIAQ